MDRAFYIVGPTGVGKSEIAAAVASRAGAEIIGADALQVYEGFPLLTAKPGPETLRRAPHWLIGGVPVTEEYSVARYRTAAVACRAAIWGRGRLALVVGGSGLYVKALTHGLSPLPEAQPELRAELDALDLPALNARLARLDPPSAGSIDRQNKRRLVRAIEVCVLTGGRFSDHRADWVRPTAARGVLLLRDKPELDRRIHARVEAMFRGGVLDEARAAADVSATASKMIGLETLRGVLSGGLTKEEAIERITAETRQYAKRQLTWFKRETAFVPLPLSNDDSRDAGRVLEILQAATAGEAPSWPTAGGPACPAPGSPIPGR